jgi:hypothetical protein
MGMSRSTLFILIALLSACTTSRWIVQETPANDLNQSRQISSVPILSLKSTPTPDQPVIAFEVRSLNTVQYPQRVEQRRFVQRYRPRYGLMVLGLAGSAGLLYVANSQAFLENGLTDNQRLGVNISASVLATASVFNLKPSGEPIFTGETRLLEQVGIGTRIDTLGRKTNAPVIQTRIEARYKGQTVLNGLQKTATNQELRIDLVNELPFRSFETSEAGVLELLMSTSTQTFEFNIPVETFLKRYVRVARRNTPIRSSPQDQAGNIVTTVAEASLLPWVSSENGWYQVLLGLNPVYMRVEDATVVWMPAGGVGGMVVSSGQRFGDIDVERNIPQLAALQPDAAAVIIANERYADPLFGNRFAGRSVELMKRYFSETLGVPIDRIRVVSDAPSSLSGSWSRFQRNNIWSELNLNPQTSRLFVYYAGKGATLNGRPVLLPIDAPSGAPIDVMSFLEYLSTLPSASTHVMFETDFVHSIDGSSLTSGALKTASDVFTESKKGWVLYASDVRQPSNTYTTEDFRTDRIYGLLTYFVCKAFQEEHLTTPELQAYLSRNLTFTSRRLHNRSQDPKWFGDTTLRLID